MEEAVWKWLEPRTEGLLDRWREWLDEAAAVGLKSFRRDHGEVLSRFVSQQIELRGRASARFPDGRLAFLTGKGLEQATPGIVADHRARRIAERAADRVVWDACSGLGSDAIALARSVPLVIASDVDAGTARCAAANLAAAGLTGRSLTCTADVGRPPLGNDALARAIVLVDPDRRPDGGRESRPERWSPTLDQTRRLIEGAAGACVKWAPGRTAEAHLTTLAPEAELEWVSLDGELKEIMVWTGAAARGTGRRATALRTHGDPLLDVVQWSGEEGLLPLDAGKDDVEHATHLVEFDVAISQSGLAGPLAEELGLTPLGDTPGGFLVARGPVDHPMTRCWPIADRCAADRRRVRSMLRGHGIGSLTVKTRSYPKPAEEVAKAFRGAGSEPGLLAVTRVPVGSLAFLLGTQIAPQRRS